jgi:type IV fimbrial biogenesis protein FimT
MSRSRSRGVTFVELVVVLAIMGVVIAIALPAFSTLMANQRIRTTAESLRSGIQLARMEALKRGRGTTFNMSALNSSWIVGCEIPVADDNDGDGLPDCPVQIQDSTGVVEGGTSAITITVDAGGGVITFSPLGLVRQLNQDGTVPFTQIDVTVPNVSSTGLRPLRVLLRAGGLSRVCDPSVTVAGDTRACTP